MQVELLLALLGSSAMMLLTFVLIWVICYHNFKMEKRLAATVSVATQTNVEMNVVIVQPGSEYATIGQPSVD